MDVSLENLDEYAEGFVAGLPQRLGTQAYVVGLQGELGAGKTTFVQAVAKALGVQESVTSPTFVIAQKYKTSHPVFSHLVHIDAYRLEDETKDTFGFQEYRKDPRNLMLVEWPTIVSYMIRLSDFDSVLTFETVDETTRALTYAQEN